MNVAMNMRPVIFLHGVREQQKGSADKQGTEGNSGIYIKVNIMSQAKS